MNKNVTMRDISKKLGISTVTVSKAISNKEGVGQELKAKILQVANEMGYRKNVLASDLREQVAHNIGLLVNSSSQNSQVLEHEISKNLLSNGYYSIIEVIGTDQSRSKILEDNKVDAIILIGAMKPAFVNAILATGVPCILVDFFYDASHLDSIIGDNLYGAYTLTKHLLALGHQKIGFVGNPHVDDQTMDRYLGYSKAINESGITMKADWQINDTNDYGEPLSLSLSKPYPTALVCSHSEMAYKYIAYFKKQGIDIPSEISIVGFEDDIFSTLSSPQLTVFSIDYNEMANTACSAIIKKIENPSYHFGRKTIGGKLIIRESSSKTSDTLASEIDLFG